jgi:hypothetical protein
MLPLVFAHNRFFLLPQALSRQTPLKSLPADSFMVTKEPLTAHDAAPIDWRICSSLPFAALRASGGFCTIIGAFQGGARLLVVASQLSNAYGACTVPGNGIGNAW